MKVGGIYVAGGYRLDNQVCGELRQISGAVDPSDYFVDLCFMTYTPGGVGSDYAAGTGIRPGMVGRKQKRFIVDVEVPPDLGDLDAYRAWMATALAEVAAIVRDHLPTKNKSYPSERLASEVDELRARWNVHVSELG
ncbi:hypothetical protein N802_01760 [Knoellia sinensis KCTC 19936]|uniref:Uncharacterized protein n=1 Tax=Knoellia sinensis KCTC 19936 TaxID=1385520 RepID=A0A0A0JCE5_9MICO|nr:hypothetical protein N802_01760 [Knoellia sinensis KCTC 19936]